MDLGGTVSVIVSLVLCNGLYASDFRLFNASGLGLHAISYESGWVMTYEVGCFKS